MAVRPSLLQLESMARQLCLPWVFIGWGITWNYSQAQDELHREGCGSPQVSWACVYCTANFSIGGGVLISTQQALLRVLCLGEDPTGTCSLREPHCSGSGPCRSKATDCGRPKGVGQPTYVPARRSWTLAAWQPRPSSSRRLTPIVPLDFSPRRSHHPSDYGCHVVSYGA